MLPISTHVKTVPIRGSIATVVNVPDGMTAVRFVCAYDAYVLQGTELAEAPSGPDNSGQSSELLQANASHERVVYAGQRLSFVGREGIPEGTLASVAFFP